MSLSPSVSLSLSSVAVSSFDLARFAASNANQQARTNKADKQPFKDRAWQHHTLDTHRNYICGGSLLNNSTAVETHESDEHGPQVQRPSFQSAQASLFAAAAAAGGVGASSVSSTFGSPSAAAAAFVAVEQSPRFLAAAGPVLSWF
jgi:hypothetical protein